MLLIRSMFLYLLVWTHGESSLVSRSLRLESDVLDHRLVYLCVYLKNYRILIWTMSVSGHFPDTGPRHPVKDY